VYRLNTYPFIHVGFFHAFVNLLALTPLLERFEAEHGTLTAVALFVGRMSSPFGFGTAERLYQGDLDLQWANIYAQLSQRSLPVYTS
jgi:hypothetical protein